MVRKMIRSLWKGRQSLIKIRWTCSAFMTEVRSLSNKSRMIS